MPNTERIPVLVTPEQKARIAARARAAKLPVGEFMRRAAESYSPDNADEAALDGLLLQVAQTTARASQALDSAFREVAASERRIAALEAAAARRRTGGRRGS
jgi:hypothetical protein